MFAARNAFMSGAAVTPVTYKGQNSSFATTVTIPSHSVGDLIVIYSGTSTGAISTVPSAGGTVPTWTTGNSGTSVTTSRVSYAVATATNTTSGTWSDSEALMCVVLSGQSASPIGGNARSDAIFAAANGISVTCPAVTMASTSGGSQLLHFAFAVDNGNGHADWASTPAGYTARISTKGVNYYAVRMITKDVTTSDGSVVIGTLNSAGRLDYTTTTVEIK